MFIRPLIYGDSRPVKVMRGSIDEFTRTIQSLPVATPNSPERRLLVRLGRLYSPPCPSLPCSSAKRDSHLEKAVDLLMEFLRSAFLLLDNSVPTPDSPMLQRVASDMDKFLPFRERAPSRICVSSDGHMYHTDTVHTRLGFFNILVFRCITFGAPCIMDGHVWFESLEDFLALSVEHPPSYLCRQDVYGTPNSHRRPETAADLWESSALWESLFDEETVLDPQWLFRFLLDKEEKGRKKRFHGVGPLTAYLIVTDCVYTGVVRKPTLLEVGTFVFSLNTGARKGLVELDLLPVPSSEPLTEEVCAQIFRELFLGVTDKLREEEISIMGFDPIVLEHTLCKVVRLHIVTLGTI